MTGFRFEHNLNNVEEIGSKEEKEFKDASPVIQVPRAKSPFDQPRQYLQNEYVYLILSYRARGLAIGVNVNPDKLCNFDCVYCEVDRRIKGGKGVIKIDTLINELSQTLQSVYEGQLRQLPAFRDLPENLLELKHVALSGDGEPTLCPQFAEIIEGMVHLRAIGQFPFFKITLITNSSGLDLPWVQTGLKLLTENDEVWAKLDAGTQDFMNKINRPKVSIEKILSNIKLVGRKRPIIIQSLFPSIRNEFPLDKEIEQYAQRLLELKNSGVQISYVQIHSARRPVTNPECEHLPLKVLSKIAKTVRDLTGLKVEVY
ncbi:MAG: radical SAM protein [Verrucomicrobiia bacterium]